MGMKRAAPFLVVVFVLLAGACGHDEEPVATGPGDGAGGVNRTVENPGDYLSVEVTENGMPKALVDGTVIALRFVDGQVSVSAGCNSMGGPYSVDDGVLVADEFATTDMGCDPARHEQDSWVAGLLTSRPTVDITVDGVVLSNPTVTARFVDRSIVEPDAELVGTTWTVTGYVDGETAMSAVVASSPATLRFEPNGFVTGNDGCNELGYSNQGDGLAYGVDGDRITFTGSPVSTAVGCPDDGDAIERYHDMLSGTVTWSVEGSQLTLLGPDGRGVTYIAGDG